MGCLLRLVESFFGPSSRFLTRAARVTQMGQIAKKTKKGFSDEHFKLQKTPSLSRMRPLFGTDKWHMYNFGELAQGSPR